ncbi:hypothetical protein GCM10007907_17290 [Chitinimonas prasina]|uniref:Transposase n=1 Tax=Chitinimonas prasina TaxID=1434937 RepID=A0ABQ5YDR2_9NEIS|nr:hypothetical protein GCM10007907_17290 [Chitinimonas prasina]
MPLHDEEREAVVCKLDDKRTPEGPRRGQCLDDAAHKEHETFQGVSVKCSGSKAVILATSTKLGT